MLCIFSTFKLIESWKEEYQYTCKIYQDFLWVSMKQAILFIFFLQILQPLCIYSELLIFAGDQFLPLIIPPSKWSCIIPPWKLSLGGVYCFQHVCHSEIPCFRQHLRFSLYNFNSCCPILFKFTPHFYQCMFDRNTGLKGQYCKSNASFNSYNKMFVLWLTVHTLWHQLLLELLFDLFSTLQICYRHIKDVHEEVWCWKKVFLTNLKGFNTPPPQKTKF